MTYNIFTDGASRGNPGNSGIGVAIYNDGKLEDEYAEFVGKKTNNEAEYLAAIKALELLKEKNISVGNLFTDSEFLVKQLTGKYQVKSSKIKPLYARAQELLKDLKINFLWIPREDNKVADALANRGIDEKKISNENNSIMKLNEQLKLDKAFFGKINCLKIQMNQFNDVYFHMGLLNSKNKEWNWIKVKFSDSELAEMIHILKKEDAKTSFFHSFDNNTTQIWCNKSKDFFTVKIKDVSKKLTIGEFELLRVILEKVIIIRNFN